MNDLLTDEMRRDLQTDQLLEAIAVIEHMQKTMPLTPEANELAIDLKRHLYLQLMELESDSGSRESA